MKLADSDEHRRFRAEVRSFLERTLTSDEAVAGWDAAALARFRDEAVERGFVYRDVPKAYGGAGAESDALKDAIVGEEFSTFPVAAPRFMCDPRGFMLIHTLLAFGTEAQRERFIPATLKTDIAWCQGYSEPGSGSDLASLQSRAVLEGDYWRIDGHKVWTSGAHESDYMFGLFRSEPDAGKHAGISYLLLDMSGEGIDARSLIQMDGGDDFSEVFLDGAKTPADHLVGERGQGWLVSRATLRYERNVIGNPNAMRLHFEALTELARNSLRHGEPALRDTGIRQRLVELEAYVRAAETSRWRQLTAEASGDEMKAGLAGLMNKLYSTDLDQRMAKLGADLAGSEALVTGGPMEFGAAGASADEWMRRYIFSMGPAIAGGASNIQRNIIGERGLGLPRDLRPKS